MLLWILLLGGVALVGSAVALILAMAKAERRARRTLYRALGLPEETIELLVSRNGDVLAELTAMRRRDLASLAEEEPPRAEAAPAGPPPSRAASAIRLVHPLNGASPPAAPPPPETVRPGGGRRRLQLPGRQSRP